MDSPTCLAARVVPRTIRRLLGVISLFFLVPRSILNGASAPDFNREIAPILSRRCLECHSGSEPSGKLSLITREGFLKGGESGAVVNSSHPEKGELLQRVSE